MIEVPIVTTFKGKGLKQANKELSHFDAGVKKLGRTMAVTFGATAIAAFAKSAISQFADDQKQVAILTNTLKNEGFGALTGQIQDFITKIQLATGVSDTELRPAFNNMLRATGSYTVAQESLNLAMDVAAGTGKSVQTVTQALSRAYLGNTASLSKLGGGLDKATLKAGDLNQITAELTRMFKGDAAAAAGTFAGEMAILNEHISEGKELIGGALVDALQKVSGQEGLGSASTAVDTFSQGIANAVTNVGDLAAKLKSLPGGSIFSGLAKNLLIGPAAPLYSLLFGDHSKQSDTFANGHTQPGQATPGAQVAANTTDKAARLKLYNDNLARLKKEKDAREKALLQEKQKALLTKTNLEILKLSNKFDLKRIELNAVLMSGASESQKLAAKAQLDLMDAQDKLKVSLDGSTASALALATAGLNELKAKDSLVVATDSATTAFTKVSAVIEGFVGPVAMATASLARLSVPDYQSFRAGERASQPTANTFNITINAPSGTTPDLVDAVQQAVQQLVRNGSPLSGGSSRGD